MLKVGEELKPDNNKLSKHFNEALKNANFKNFVEKLKLDEDTLMKYTSTLEESSIEFNNCLNCSNLSECKNKVVGYAYLPKVSNNKIQFNYKPCHYKQSNDKLNCHVKNIKYYNLPVSLTSASWDKIEKKDKARFKTIEWLNNFLTDFPKVSKGLYLTGNFGCGKTYLVVAMFNELAKKGVRSAIVFWPEYLRDLKTSFDTDYADRIEYIKLAPLLLIDDLGAEVTTSWARDEILCSILQYRMDEKLPTFITSNLSIDNLGPHLSNTKDGVEVIKSQRIIERIKQLTEEIEMISKNMRS